MSTASKQVGNRALAEIYQIATHQKGPANSRAFLWAGFDDQERVRLCRLSKVPVTVGKGEYQVGRVIVDWFDFSSAERSRLLNTLQILVKLGRKVDRIGGLA